MSVPPDEQLPNPSPADATDDASAPAGRRRKAPITTALCAIYILAVIAALLLMRLAGERWWLATLLLFSPRWIWLAPLIVVLPMVLALRRRMAVPVLLAGAVVLFAIMGFRLPWRKALPAPSAHETVRVFTCNLHNRQSDSLLLDQVEAHFQPDVILYQDYSHIREPRIVHTPGWHGEQFGSIYIASRFPFHRVDNLLPFDEAARMYASHGWPVGVAVCCAIDLPGGQAIHLINLHLASAHWQLVKVRDRDPTGPGSLQADSERRAYESMIVSAAARRLGGPMIVAGDFNTPDDSPLFRQAWGDFDDAFNMAGFGFGTTYAQHHTWLRIDHVLYDPSWQCRECWVGPPIGSGHRPVMAVLQR
ncbi:MAG TPA: endonuclease/exonuclease/phosphatase family protein [Tepidisphaeraceae bacterium]|jgi:endonuclease/exonuclease/phosphatase (EEP) superfamily protein YafD